MIKFLLKVVDNYVYIEILDIKELGKSGTYKKFKIKYNDSYLYIGTNSVLIPKTIDTFRQSDLFCNRRFYVKESVPKFVKSFLYAIAKSYKGILVQISEDIYEVRKKS